MRVNYPAGNILVIYIILKILYMTCTRSVIMLNASVKYIAICISLQYVAH